MNIEIATLAGTKIQAVTSPVELEALVNATPDPAHFIIDIPGQSIQLWRRGGSHTVKVYTEKVYSATYEDAQAALADFLSRVRW